MTQQYESFEKKKLLYYITGLIATFMAGLGYTWSIVQTPFVQALGGEAVTATVALCYTVTILCSTMSPTILGGLTKNLKANQMLLIGGVIFGLGYLACGHVTTIPMLFLTYGVGTGVGAGLIYPTMMGYAASVIPEKQGITSGLMAGMYGGAAMIWSPILARMIEGSGITRTFDIIGVLSLVVLIASAFILKPIPEGYLEYKQAQMGQTASAKKKAAPKSNVPDLTRGQMVKTSTFYVAAAVYAFGLTSGMMVINQASQILQNAHGMTATQAATYVSLFSFMSLAGRIVWGTVTDHTDKYVTVCLICVIQIVTMGILTSGPATIVAIISMAVTAFCYGGFGGTITPVTADLFGSKYITENYGVMFLMFGIAGFIGPRAAVTLNNNGDYSKAFLVGCILSIISTIAALIVRNKVKATQKAASTVCE